MTALRPLDPSKCLALAVRRPPGPNLALVARVGVPVAMRNAPSLEEKEISAVINACMDRRGRGEFSGYAASKQCAAFRLVFGMDLAMRNRDPECISNELRPECAYDRKKSEAHNDHNSERPRSFQAGAILPRLESSHPALFCREAEAL